MFRPDIILSGWLDSKHQLCNETPHPLFVLIQESVLSNILPSTMSPHPLYVLIQESVLSHILPSTNSLTLSLSWYRSQSCPTFHQQPIPSPSLCFDKRVHSGHNSVSEGINVCVEIVWCLSKDLQQAHLAADVSHWFHLLLVLQLWKWQWKLASLMVLSLNDTGGFDL